MMLTRPELNFTSVLVKEVCAIAVTRVSREFGILTLLLGIHTIALRKPLSKGSVIPLVLRPYVPRSLPERLTEFQLVSGYLVRLVRLLSLLLPPPLADPLENIQAAGERGDYGGDRVRHVWMGHGGVKRRWRRVWEGFARTEGSRGGLITIVPSFRAARVSASRSKAGGGPVEFSGEGRECIAARPKRRLLAFYWTPGTAPRISAKLRVIDKESRGGTGTCGPWPVLSQGSRRSATPRWLFFVRRTIGFQTHLFVRLSRICILQNGGLIGAFVGSLAFTTVTEIQLARKYCGVSHPMAKEMY